MGVNKQMNVFFKFEKWLKKGLKKIHIVDKCLIVFMIILLIQSSYSLFANHTGTAETNNVDIIIRTSTASIFGYFLSANFIKKQIKSNQPSKHSTEINKNINTARNNSTIKSSHSGNHNCIQIFIATAIGIFSLCVLLFSGDFDINNQSALATLAQFRDFVSACVGFLIGSATDINDGDDTNCE